MRLWSIVSIFMAAAPFLYFWQPQEENVAAFIPPTKPKCGTGWQVIGLKQHEKRLSVAETPNAQRFLSLLHCVTSKLRVCRVSLEALSIVQQLHILLRWWISRLAERLPPLCPLSLGIEWVDMVSSSHNKHFSKWASSDDKHGHIECPAVFSRPSLWWCCPTKSLLSNCTRK